MSKNTSLWIHIFKFVTWLIVYIIYTIIIIVYINNISYYLLYINIV